MAGYLFRPTYTAKDGAKRESRTWWLGYSVAGRKYRESAKTTKRKEAETVLARRLAARGLAPAQQAAERTTFEDLCEIIREDYRRNGRKSTRRLDLSISHLSSSFAGWIVAAIDEAAVDKHVTKRLKAGVAPSTVNREIAALRRMLKLGYRLRLVERLPSLPSLTENNARRGFFEDSDLQGLVQYLPADLRPLVEVAFITGWRKGELLSRDWRHVDFEGGWLHLEDSKNGEARQFPLTARLRDVLERQRERCRALEKKTGKIIPCVFFRGSERLAGQRIVNANKAWKKAVKAAGLSGRIIHDMRRTAVRNLVRAGVPEKVAMGLTGHKTRAVFDRYMIVNEEMLRDAGGRLDALHSVDKRKAEGT
jgi:integrase